MLILMITPMSIVITMIPFIPIATRRAAIYIMARGPLACMCPGKAKAV
jgi:hypothetical protein